MKLTVETSALRRKFGEEKALEIIKNAGFDGVDFSFDSNENEISSLSGDYIKNANTSKALLEKYGCYEICPRPWKAAY